MSRPLAVGLNLLYLVENAGGLGTYARGLIPAMLDLEPDLRLVGFASRELAARDRESDWGRRVEWVTLPVTVTHGPPWNFLRTMGAQWGAVPLAARRRGLDLVHGLANTAPLAGIPSVVTVLDLIWLRHRTTLDRRAAIGMRVTTRPSAARATRVLAISEAVKRDLVASYGLPADRIDVTLLGFALDRRAAPLDEAEIRRRHDLGDAPILLCVAQKREHKNLGALIRALPAVPGAVLVLPGAPTPHEEQLRALAAKLGVGDRVRFPAWIGDDELEGLYAAARAFVLPSFEEGFGLPVLEAMGRGVPVACSNTSSLPEVAGDAALLFDPRDSGAVAGAIGRLLHDGALRADLVRRGHERARSFPWRRTAEATLAAYRRALCTSG